MSELTHIIDGVGQSERHEVLKPPFADDVAAQAPTNSSLTA